MSTLRGQRVIIASLFLPDSVYFGESNPSTPAPARLIPSFGQQQPKSIVDDLTDKQSRNATPTVRSPAQEAVNPFASLPVNQSRTRLTAHSFETLSSPSLRRRSSSRHHSERNRLACASGEPYHIEPNPHCNGGLKNAVDSVTSNKLKSKLWVGTLGTSTDTISQNQRRDIDNSFARLPYHPSLPVWVPDAEFQSCYAEFCHQVLWPCLHYAIPDAPKTKMFYESASFKQYVAVNQRFADAIISVHQEGDIIWINDYHLMLLPSLLRSSGKISPSTPIGFFMHVAFPSSEIFRCLSVRQDLLRGLLGADLVGFQTANYARHFRQTVHRILAYEALPKGIMVVDGDGAAREESIGPDGQRQRGRFVDVGVFPMGIDVGQLRQKKADPEVKEWIQLLTQRYAGMKIVVGRDKLDEVQGVRHKIKAFEYFLERHPEFQGKAILIQIALPTQSPHAHTISHPLPESSDVTEAIARINARFSTLTYQPVIFLHTQDLTFSQYLALLSTADAFIVTSLREGMALRSHEFVECQEGRCRPLILSEFTGSYSYSGFRSCIAINPWDKRGTADAINQALTMSDEEARMRWEDLHNHVTTQTAQAFVTTFLNRTIRAHAEDQQSASAHGSSQGQDSDESVVAVPNLKQGLGKVMPRWKHSRRRIVFVDLEGTLWKRDLSREGLVRMEEDYKRARSPAQLGLIQHDKKEEADTTTVSKSSETTEEAKEEEVIMPPEDVLQVLERLVSDGRNEVWLLSGLRVRGLLERIAKRMPRLGIVAENGCFIKTIQGPPPSSSTQGVGIPKVKVGRMSSFSAGMSVSPPRLNNAQTTQQKNERGGGGGGEWLNMVANFNLSWKSACLEILHYFAERTPGSFIEERDASIVFRFWTGAMPVEGTAEDPDRTWARRQAAEAQNHIFDSLGERYGLRIIPGKNSFLVLPNNISRSTAVGAILHPGGPAHSPLSRAWMSPNYEFMEGHAHGGGGFDGGIQVGRGGMGGHGGGGGLDGGVVRGGGGEEGDHQDQTSFVLAVSGDERLLRRLGEVDGAETCSASGRGTDARWKLDSPGEAVAVLWGLARSVTIA